MDDTGDVIMVIWVPIAKREQKPVYINDDLFGGTFRRNWEGGLSLHQITGQDHAKRSGGGNDGHGGA